MNAAIRFDSVSKKFTLHHERARSFQELAIGFFRRNNRSREEFWALRDVSFTVEQGETVGIIGPNGAGKSTVLKLISRIIEPTSGRIAVHGRIGALLELGAGFHPDLTGRENIYLNGSILGLSRAEIRRRLDDIIGFAELERFIDVPVKHYSSGMYVRLGFSVAVHTDPEILLIDEVLAVGDQAFQTKCMEQIGRLKRDGLTIVLVSHNLEVARGLCDRAIWLDQGRVAVEGQTDRVIDAYLAEVAIKEEARLAAEHEWQQSRWGNGEVAIVDVRFLDANGKERHVFVSGEMMRTRIRYRAARRVERPVFGVAIYRSDGIHVNGPNTRLSGYDIDWIEGEGEVDYVIESLPLLEGSYDFSVAIYDWECLYPYDHQHRMYKFLVQRGMVKEIYGLVYMPSHWEHRRL